MAALGEFERELLRLSNAFRRGREKPAQQIRNCLDPILARLFQLAFEIVPKGDAFSPVDLGVLDPDEFQIVGQQDVVRQRHIALHLIRFENLIEVGPPRSREFRAGPGPNARFCRRGPVSGGANISQMHPSCKSILHAKDSDPRLARRIKTTRLKHKPYRNFPLAPNPGFVSRRALQMYDCANPQSYQNVSRETF
jgi:hypothetical protein